MLLPSENLIWVPILNNDIELSTMKRFDTGFDRSRFKRSWSFNLREYFIKMAENSVFERNYLSLSECEIHLNCPWISL